MRKTFRIAAALCLLTAAATLASAQGSRSSRSGPSSAAPAGASATRRAQASLYERLGGLPALKAVVDEFVTRVGADSRINAKFARTNIPRLKLHLVEQLCVATGGPCEYTGRDMRQTHRNMHVTEGEFDALVEDLVSTLDKFNVASREKDELLAILSPLKSQIVEVQGDTVGQPLPAGYKPASALSASRINAGPKMKKTKSNAGKKGKS